MPFLLFQEEFMGVKYTIKSNGYKQIIKITGLEPIEFTDTTPNARRWVQKRITELKKVGQI
jgi:hypothetical protein